MTRLKWKKYRVKQRADLDAEAKPEANREVMIWTRTALEKCAPAAQMPSQVSIPQPAFQTVLNNLVEPDPPLRLMTKDDFTS